MDNRDTKAILEYHEVTKHSERSVRSNRHVLDWENQPLPLKVYRDLDPIPLVRDFPDKGDSALEAMARTPRPAAGEAEEERIPDLTVLSRVLQLSAGITRSRRHAAGTVYFRAYPNTGALHHVDLYLVVGELPGLSSGVYHFGPQDFALRCLREGDWRGVLVEASGNNPDLARAPVIVVSASTYWRNSWKYQARAWRHCFWDAGTMHANLLAVAETENLEPRLVLGWADRPVERLLALDPMREGALTMVSLGRCLRPPPTAPDVPELRYETELLSSTEIDYPEIRAAHAASSLADAAEAVAWRGGIPARQETAATDSQQIVLRPLPDGDLPPESLDRLIVRRGSTRAFDAGRSITFEELSTVLDRAIRGVDADFLEPPSATLLDLYLIVNAVDGLAPGAYHYRPAERSLVLLREGDFRETAGRLGLGQLLPAAAAVNIYSLVDLAGVLERFGNRGYRAAQIEGGILGGRLYLAAYAQRVGATGLTFFDDEVVDFFSPHAAGKNVMFLVAIGHANRATQGPG
jgi:SagB-type dehydrogenase family enzyme